MKRNLQFLFTLVFIFSFSSAFSQANEVYWRENFTPDGLTSDPAGSTTVSDYTGTAGVWKFYNVWRTTGTACEGTTPPFSVGSNGQNWHIRSTNNTASLGVSTASNTFDDTAFLISPDVTKGINELHFYRSRVSRKFTIWVSADAAVNTTDFTGWNLVGIIPKANLSPVTLCTDTAIIINSSTAKRVMIRFERGSNSDIDSVVLTSVQPLPVRFAGSNISLVSEGIKLNWQVALEENIIRYDIERSVNGREFTVVGAVPASKNSEYNWLDKSPLNGINLYRIKAIDKDGSAIYTSILKINTSNTKSEISVAPNPIKGGELNVQLSSLTKGSYSLKLYNNVGQLVYSSQLSTEGGSISQSFTLPSTIKSGIYNLQVTGGDVKLNKRVVVE